MAQFSGLGQNSSGVVDVHLILKKIVIPFNDILSRIDDPFAEQDDFFIAAMGMSPNAPTSVYQMPQR